MGADHLERSFHILSRDLFRGNSNYLTGSGSWTTTADGRTDGRPAEPTRDPSAWGCAENFEFAEDIRRAELLSREVILVRRTDSSPMQFSPIVLGHLISSLIIMY